jgi:hypothetical protein
VYRYVSYCNEHLASTPAKMVSGDIERAFIGCRKKIEEAHVDVIIAHAEADENVAR